MKFLVSTLITALCLSLLGCGYTMSSGSGGVVLGSTTRDGEVVRPEPVVLEVVQNQLVPPRPGLGLELTSVLKREIAADRRFVLTRVGSGVTQLEVTLVRFDEPALVRNSQDEQTEIGLTARAVVRVRRGNQSAQSTVLANADYAPGRLESRAEGKDRLWRDLSLRIIDEIQGISWGLESPKATDSSTSEGQSPQG